MDWLQLLQNFGLAVVILVFIGFCIVSVSRWSAPRVDKLIDRVLIFIDKVTNESERIDRLEEKVATIWEFILRRASSELVAKGLGVMNSPVIITDEARSWLSDFAIPLKKLYKEVGGNLSPADFIMEIEDRFGQDLLIKVCIPYGLTQGSCLIIAAQIAKEPQ